MGFSAEQSRVGQFDAGEDLGDAKHTFVKLDNDGDVVQCDTADERALGVLLNNPPSGGTAAVCLGGVAKLFTSATVTPMATLGTTGNGRGRVRSGSNQSINAMALESGASGDVITVLVFGGGSGGND